MILWGSMWDDLFARDSEGALASQIKNWSMVTSREFSQAMLQHSGMNCSTHSTEGYGRSSK